MLDLGWSEMLVILVVALIVIGPKDLPKVARQIGRWTGKARAMAREFQRSFDDMAREAELEEIKANLQKMNPHSITQTIRETVDPKGELDELARKLDVREDLERASRLEEPPAAAVERRPGEPAPSPEGPAPALAGSAERQSERG
ncbi:MAG: Sec-independent protein translocase protein TatB [Geminicoccaceae bacterium]|nr:Sec-independent protein translocase protein TatB [Geminicoccaceae bacterium]MCX8101672.1 Sec-independent protein translocase protein TatB [Geminicoccaceae bacterium]MDW8371450.1 Sec-independent protein translocase protein TatB [Geminicoccaceae bacterium]